jgi:hypothetical protein
MASLNEAKNFYKNNTLQFYLNTLEENNKNWIFYFINYGYTNIIMLEKLLDHFIKLNDKKIFDDFLLIINEHQIIDKIYKSKIIENEIFINYNILKNLIFLGAKVNKDLLDIKLNEDLYKYIDFLNNTIVKIKKFNYKTYYNSAILKGLEYDLLKEKEKIASYNLIKDAYYAQKINRFIKYVYNDKYYLTKFRLRIEYNKYLDLYK